MASYPMESWNLSLQPQPHQQQQQFLSLETPAKPQRKARYQKKKANATVTCQNRVKRKKCPAKEKERNEAINSGFEVLQSRISCIQNGEKSSKIPKVKILRIAIRYINYLKRKLETPDELYNPSMDDFVLQAMDVIQTKNCYTKRAAQEIDGGGISGVSSPQDLHDAGYISPPESSTSPSNYSSDYFEASNQCSSLMDSSSSSMPLSLSSNVNSNISFLSTYVPQQFQMMDYENYPAWKQSGY